ncbi:shikimate 5-dehydrogenase [Microbacterium sp. P01]|uniref:shikimate 5-dehydrogenase n=1 Tax=unclassified Microbacterium TaxID=2609290 RepID=UPI0036714D87
MPILNKDMTLCISLAARPSNLGTRFHNFLYDELGLNYVYKAFAPISLPDAIAGVRGLGIRGAAVSMPYKEDVIALLDGLDESAAAIDSVNTVVNTDGRLIGHNTDYTAVRSLLTLHDVPASHTFLLRGSGGMAKAVAAALRDAGFARGTIIARNEEAGRALAGLYGFDWHPTGAGLTADLLVNVTPLGMAGGADAEVLAFDAATVAEASVVFDVVAMPAVTPLLQAAQDAGVRVITGVEVAALQAEEQFVLYTGVRPRADQVRRASEFSREG